jgi:hypothetical protein
MSRTNISRRKFAAATSFGVFTACAQRSFATQDAPAQKVDKNGPREAIFERDYDAPSFKPGWKKAQVNRTMA